MSRPDFDALWDYEQPGRTEAAFRELLAADVDGSDVSYRLQLLTQIARAQGLQRKFADAHATLDGVETQVDDAPSLLPAVRYCLERGRVHNSAGDRDAARPLFQRAWDLSRPQPDAAFFAVDAAHMMAIAADSFDDTVAWNRAALEHAEAATDEKARGWRGSLYNNLGWSYQDHGDFDEALSYFEQALRWQVAHGTGRQVRVARWAVGRTLRALGRVDDALFLQEGLLEEWRRSGEQEGGFVSEEIAECLLALGRADESRPLFATAHALLAQDPWLVADEPDRLQRLEKLSKTE